MMVDRRQLLKHALGTTSSLLGLPRVTAAAREGREPRLLPAGVHLFLDSALIAGERGFTRVVRRPERLAEPVVSAARDRCFQPYVSVLRDPRTKRFRMWYNTAVDATRSHIGYMESDDGVRFLRPHRELDDPSGLPVGFGAYVVDDGPEAADPGRRYKLAWEHGGLFTATSPDGLRWTATSRRPVLGGIGDIVALGRDPIRGRYLLTCKVHSTPEDGYKGSTPNAKEGYRRLVGQSVSRDGIAWSAPRRIIVADGGDEGVTEFYGIGPVLERGGLLIGLLKVLRDDLPPEPGGAVTGIGYTCLAWTRDGERWERDRDPFLPRNPVPGTWDRAMAWGDCLLPVGDEVFVYYGGYARGHKVERFKERQLGLARLPRDRFVSRNAGPGGGSLRTPLMRLDASSLLVNADIAGELRVRACDERDRPIDGFDAPDCAPLRGDSLGHPVRWNRPLSDLRRTPLRLEFTARDARLYGFEVMA